MDLDPTTSQAFFDKLARFGWERQGSHQAVFYSPSEETRYYVTLYDSSGRLQCVANGVTSFGGGRKAEFDIDTEFLQGEGQSIEDFASSVADAVPLHHIPSEPDSPLGNPNDEPDELRDDKLDRLVNQLLED